MNEQLVAEYNRRHAFTSSVFRERACTPPVLVLSVLLGCLLIPVIGGLCTLAVSPFLPTSTSTTTTTSTSTFSTSTTSTSTTTSSSSTTSTSSRTTSTTSTSSSSSTSSTTHTMTTTSTTSSTSSSTTSVTSTTTTITTSTTTLTTTTTSLTSTTTSLTATTFTVLPFPSQDGLKRGNYQPSADEESPVFLSMTVQNVGYGRLLENPGLQAAFEAQVCGAIALEAGHGVAPDHVLLDLSEGSVAIKATIVSLGVDRASSVESKLKKSTRLGPRVAQSVGAVQGIAAISTGLITVTDINTTGPKVTDSEILPIPGFSFVKRFSTTFLAIGGSTLLAVLCLLIGCGRRSTPGYVLAPGEELLPKSDENGELHGENGGPDVAVTEETVPDPGEKVSPREQQDQPAPPLAKASTPQPTSEPKQEKASSPAPVVPGGAKQEKATTPASEGKAPSPPPRSSPRGGAKVEGKASSNSRGSPRGSNDRGEAGAAYAAYIRLAKDMCFSEEQARAALSETGGNSELALERLLAQP